MHDQTKQRSSLLDSALEYAALGIPVFPCAATKKPLTENGFKDASTEERQVKHWWGRWPEAMIGVPTGPASGIDVLDLDLDLDEGINGHEFVPNWSTLSPVMVQTPSGGAHLYFRSEGEVRNSSSL